VVAAAALRRFVRRSSHQLVATPSAKMRAALRLLSSGTAARGSSPWWVRSGAVPAQESLESLEPVARPPPPPPLPALRAPARRPADSLCGAALPVRGDAALRRAFTASTGNVRVGRLLEEIDAFAGSVAARHCAAGGGAAPAVLVTAALDRLDLLRYPLPVADLLLVGAVSQAGASSLTVEVDVAAEPEAGSAELRPLLAASLTFVARDEGNAAVRVPPLQAPPGGWEAAMAAAGSSAAAARRAARSASLSRQPPTAAELQTVHSLFLSQQAEVAGAARTGAERPLVAASAHAVQTTVLTQPQDRNVYGRIFGGWLMRSAFESAYAAGWLLSGSAPKFLSLDGVDFLHPVEVGRMLTFDAVVDYVREDGRTYSVAVTARMREPGAVGGEPRVTNTFFFSFLSDLPAPRLRLERYEDALRFIAGERRAAAGRALAAERAAAGVALRFPAPVVARLRERAPAAAAAGVLLGPQA